MLSPKQSSRMIAKAFRRARRNQYEYWSAPLVSHTGKPVNVTIVRAGSDQAYLRRVRLMPCCACGSAPPSEAHHSTVGRGMAQKSPDLETMPLCGWCHRELHDLNGRFKGWTRDRLREWQAQQVEKTQKKLGVQR